MCCPGCKAVAELISGGGYDSFYRLRTGYNERPAIESAQDAYQVYDEASNQASFVGDAEGGRRRAQLLLGGVSCAACTWLIESVLGSTSGIHSANVNLARQSLTVEWQPSELALSDIFRQLHQLGYEPHPWHQQAGAELLRREQRTALGELAVAGLAMMQVGMFAIALHAGDIQGMEDNYRDLMRWVSLLIASLVVVYAARSFFRNAWANLRHGRLVMDVPVAAAIALAYSASAWATVSGTGQVYFDSIAMFTFFLLLGRFLERRVRQREVLRQTDLRALLPASCQRKNGSGWETVATTAVRTGDHLLLKGGSVIPADGTLVAGAGSVDEAAFTGEHYPRSVSVGDRVTAGTLLGEGSAEIRVDSDIAGSRLAAMLDLLGSAGAGKPAIAQLADRIAGRFVAAILLIAGVVGAYYSTYEPESALWITLSVLVVSCPCALALATPAALTRATAALRERGLLLTGANTLESINHCDTVIFDKTGTLTEGRLERRQVLRCGGMGAEQCLAIAAGLEQNSNHPIARAFADIDQPATLESLQSFPGQGVTGVFEGEQFALGHPHFITAHCPTATAPPPGNGHWIGLASHSCVYAWIELADALRAEAEELVTALRRRGLRVELLTGDPSGQGELLATELGMDSYRTGCAPADKLSYIRSLQAGGRRVAMAGDGLNDAPVLAAADVSFAVSRATDLAKSRADVIMLTGRLNGLLDTLDFGQKTRRIIHQNMAWALLYNGLAVPLAAAGMVPPWAAAIGMSASSLLVVLNSLRLS
jgi:Cu2+-exporting ATPase